MELLQKRVRQEGKVADAQVPPLVVQAQVLAAYLAPPPPLAPAPVVLPKTDEMAKTVSSVGGKDQDSTAPVVLPKVSSLKFSVKATSYYANQPAKSMALIAEPGGEAGGEWWVREGHKLGHFVVHEIRQGAVVFRQGQDLKEVAVDKPQETKGLVRDVRTAEPKISVAAVDELPLLDSATGPNDVASLPSGQ